MPPRKKARIPVSGTSTPSRDVLTPVVATPADTETPKGREVDSSYADALADPWTDEQEISLFKAIVRWKPAGMHKHFRMMAIAQQLHQSPHTSPHDTHTRIPGIWQKLSSLYNLDLIDERENSILEADDEDGGSPANEAFHPFSLPERDYGEAMFDRRLAPEGSSSPPATEARSTVRKRGRGSERGSGGGRRTGTGGDGREALHSSPLPTRGSGSRGGRGRGASKMSSTPRAKAEASYSSPAAETAAPNQAVADEETGDGDEADEADEAGSRTRRNAPKPSRGRGGGRKSQGGVDTRRSSRRK